MSDLDFVERIREANKDFIEQHENQEEQPHDIDKEFKGSSNKTNEIPSEELWKYFTKPGFLSYDAETNKYYPTVAVILLFGKDPIDFLAQSKVLAEAHFIVKVHDSIGK